MDATIVIPTRSCSEGLDNAVRSALVFRQHLREIVLSVNTADAATVGSLAARYPEVRVVSPGTELGHAAHWEFALGQTSGEWVALLTDRGVLREDWLTSLEKLCTRAPVVTFRTIAVMRRSAKRFDVQLPWFSGEVSHQSSAPWKQAGRRMEFAEHGPYLLNSLVHRSVLEQMQNSPGRICGDLVGDCGFYSRCLASGTDWVHVEKPLVVMHSAETGIGASLVTGIRTPALDAFLRNLKASGGFRHAPLPEIVTNMNVRANEFAAAFPRTPLDAQSYASALAAELGDQRETFPADAGRHLAAFVRERSIALPPIRPRRRVRGFVRRVARWCLGTGTSPIHKRLNLPVRSFDSLTPAIDWAAAAALHPNGVPTGNSAWR